MKKRLRKKLHLAEFREWGVQLTIRLKTPDGFDQFFDDFIEHAIEANDCYCGGGGQDDHISVIVELGMDLEAGQKRLDGIRKWLSSRDDIREYLVGETMDIGYDEAMWEKSEAQSDAFLKESQK